MEEATGVCCGSIEPASSWHTLLEELYTVAHGTPIMFLEQKKRQLDQYPHDQGTQHIVDITLMNKLKTRDRKVTHSSQG